MENLDVILKIIASVLVIIGAILGSSFVIKKYIGRDDNSINIGDGANIKDSFNTEKNFIKKTKNK